MISNFGFFWSTSFFYSFWSASSFWFTYIIISLDINLLFLFTFIRGCIFLFCNFFLFGGFFRRVNCTIIILTILAFFVTLFGTSFWTTCFFLFFLFNFKLIIYETTSFFFMIFHVFNRVSFLIFTFLLNWGMQRNFAISTIVYSC